MRSILGSTLALALCWAASAQAQDAPPPPEVGEATAGEPAILPEEEIPVVEEVDPDDPRAINEVVAASGTETQYRRRGYIYELKMEPRGGATQYMSDDGSGQLQSRENGLEDTTNLPKWRIGRW